MPGPLSGNSFNVGRDATYRLAVNGQIVGNLNLITDVGRKAMTNLHEVIPINNDGVPVFRSTFSGYEYDFHITRQDGTFDTIVDALQQHYYTGQLPPTA